MSAIVIHDEILAEAIDEPRDRHSIEKILNRSIPDPFADMWDELRRIEGDSKN
jgi:hypothetical protein